MRDSGMLVCGYYGMKNYGDDLFSMIASKGGALEWNASHVTVASPPLIDFEANFSTSQIFSSLYSELGAAGKIVRALSAIKEMIGCHHILFGGGSVFSSRESGLIKLISKLAKDNNKNLSAIGVSVGPFSSVESEKTVLEILRRFDYISTRDRWSFDYLKNVGYSGRLNFGADLAGAHKLVIPRVTKGRGKKSAVGRIGYSACNYSGSDLDLDWVDKRSIRILIEECLSKDIEVVVVNLNSHTSIGDRLLNIYVYESLKEKNVKVDFVDYSIQGVSGAWSAISECDLFITGRLHGAMTAFLCDVPFLLIEYHQKCTDFLDDILQPNEMRVDISGDGYEDVFKLSISNPKLPELDVSDYENRAYTNFTAAPWKLI